MALTDEGTGFNVSMPVAPAYSAPSYGGGYGGFGGFGGDWSWIILLLLVCGGGWGGMGFGGFGGGYGGAMWDFPWLINGQQGINNNVSDGFRDAQLNDSVTSVRDGVSNLATQLCNCCGDMQMALANGFAGVNASINGAQNAISNQLYNNEIASLNRSFAEQTANTAGFTGVQSSLCDIRYGNATNTRDILTALTAGVQSIKDQLCDYRNEQKDDTIANLRSELMYARGQASQDVQTARILAGQASEIDGVYNRLKNCPVPSMPVYGMQPVFTCQPQQSCGCGCGNNF